MPLHARLHRSTLKQENASNLQMQIVYLHGFASSPQSSKAAMFRARLAERGVTVHTPDLNEPDFSTLTVTRMVQQARGIIEGLAPGPVALVGSSLGGFVAVQTALAMPAAIDRLVLLAPALDLGGERMRDLGDRGIDDWRRTNRLDVFHYGYGRVMPLHFEFYADAQRHDSMNARVEMPILIFQGTRDTTVDPQTVEEWARARPNASLHLLDDDHQLSASFDYIWETSEPFLLGGRRSSG